MEKLGLERIKWTSVILDKFTELKRKLSKHVYKFPDTTDLLAFAAKHSFVPGNGAADEEMLHHKPF